MLENQIMMFADSTEEGKIKLYRKKYRELGKLLSDAGIPKEQIRVVQEQSIYYKYLNTLKGIDIEELKLKTKLTHKGYGLKFVVRGKANYERLKQTYGQISSIWLNTDLLLKNTYGDQNSNTVIQETEDQNA